MGRRRKGRVRKKTNVGQRGKNKEWKRKKRGIGKMNDGRGNR